MTINSQNEMCSFINYHDLPYVVAYAFVLVTNTYRQLTRHSIILIKKSAKGKNICV